MFRRITVAIAIAIGLFVAACTEGTEETPVTVNQVSNEALLKIQALGFNTNDYPVYETDGGYIVENDIFLAYGDLERTDLAPRGITEEHYATNNLVTGLPRVITVFLPTTGNRPFSNTESRALNGVIRAYNRENLLISFQRVNSAANADIVFSRLSPFEEFLGILGSAGFPTASGDPFPEIKMSGILESSYGFSIGGIATVFGHEMGHCIGLRHTDYMDRSFSCGGAPDNEGDGGVGANYIPGTPVGPEAGSYMLACTDGSTRRFTTGDKTALAALY